MDDGEDGEHEQDDAQGVLQTKLAKINSGWTRGMFPTRFRLVNILEFSWTTSELQFGVLKRNEFNRSAIYLLIGFSYLSVHCVYTIRPVTSRCLLYCA